MTMIKNRVPKNCKSLERNDAIFRAKRMLAVFDREGVTRTTVSHISRETGLCLTDVTRVWRGQLDTDANYRLCPACKVMVQLPCVLCKAKRYFSEG